MLRNERWSPIATTNANTDTFSGTIPSKSAFDAISSFPVFFDFEIETMDHFMSAASISFSGSKLSQLPSLASVLL